MGKGSLRFSVEEALERGWISREAAQQVRREAASQAGRHQPRGPSVPQRKLWEAVEARWPARARQEYAGVVPGRRFRIDIAFPVEKVGVEVDGFRWHSLHLEVFKKDRRRQNLLCLHGWRVLRYFPGQIHRDIEGVLSEIGQALSNSESRP